MVHKVLQAGEQHHFSMTSSVLLVGGGGFPSASKVDVFVSALRWKTLKYLQSQ